MRSFLRSLAFSTVLVSVIPYMQDKSWRVRCQGEHFQQQEHRYHTESEFSYSIHLQSFKAIGDQVGFCRDARRTLPGKQPRRGLPGTSSAGCCCRLHLQSTRLDLTRWRETLPLCRSSSRGLPWLVHSGLPYRQSRDFFGPWPGEAFSAAAINSSPLSNRNRLQW